MSPVHVEELLPELQVMHTAGQTTRVDAFLTIRSLSHALRVLGLPLSVFQKDPDLCLGPLGPTQQRMWSDAEHAYKVADLAMETEGFEIPSTFDATEMPLLISVSDQGPLNLPPLDLLSYKLRAHVVVQYDPYHRAYNDLKDALRKSGLFRTFLEMSIIFNLNYGPGGTGRWLERKQQTLKEILRTGSPHKEPYLSYLIYAAKERRLQDPTSAASREQLWASMGGMTSAAQKGPVMKLMRWFSYWDCNVFYQGELWLTKILLMHGSAEEGEALDLDDRFCSGELPPREELRALKMKYGTWAVAKSLLTPQTYWRNELIFSVGRPVWSAFSSRAAQVKTPAQVASHASYRSSLCVASGWKPSSDGSVTLAVAQGTRIWPGEISYPVPELPHR